MISIDESFFETPAGQTIAGAHKYLSAAKELRFSETWKSRPTLLQAPTIHLLAHGIELLLKYHLLADGKSPDDVRRSFGHDLVKLWNDEANRLLRPFILDQAVDAWDEAKFSGKWPGNDFSDDPRSSLLGALDHIGYLHGSDSGYALRYIVTPNTWAPRPAFLIDVFGYAAERCTMNPRLLIEK
ncbi:hypothetical protein [Rhizobium leguminosarum]|uniref:hypothetical protein n=1 Tax=Rhizobium leguminosarum TaxID=384 RepID=UPI001C8FE4D6|nr:hypothetical protein [Rhizobium leguminosarum]MBY3043701.1 hypothetical protein [Rhizobium leguminosarum]